MILILLSLYLYYGYFYFHNSILNLINWETFHNISTTSLSMSWLINHCNIYDLFMIGLIYILLQFLWGFVWCIMVVTYEFFNANEGYRI